VFTIAIVLAGCGGKKDSGNTGSGSSAEKPIEDKPMTCPAGNVIQDGKCVAVVTPEKIEAVGKQQTRLDELSALLDKAEPVATAIDLLGAFRKLDEWKNFVSTVSYLKEIDAAFGELETAVKTLRTFKASLSEASTKLGNLKGELDRVMKETGAARKIEEVRAQVSAQVRSAMEPLAAEVSNTIKNALIPLDERMEKVGAAIKAACATLTLSGGSADAKKLCKEAEKAFEAGVEYLADFKQRPAKLFEEVSSELEKQLEQLVDAEAKKLIDAAQLEVNEALKLPPK
jgi:hypothetical protein